MVSKTHLTDFLKSNAAAIPDKAAIVCEDKSLSWKQLWELTQKVASNIAPIIGDSQEQKVVALLFPNSWQYVVAYLAILETGHIAMPLDVIFKPLEIEAVLQQIPSELVIADEANMVRLPSRTNNHLFEDLAKAENSAEHKKLRMPADRQIASLMFTSGTTGQPKATTYTHSNHIWNIEVCSQVWKWDSSDSLLISLRLSHWYGLVMGLTGVLYHGNTMYLQERFEPEATLAELSKGNVTIFTHVAGTFNRLLDVQDYSHYDLSKVRLLISGGAPLPPPAWQEFKRRFGHEILEVYGSSESGRIASNLLDERIPGSPGRPLPGVQIRIGEASEVQVRSKGVFPGYYKNDELTKAGFTDDGWWRTGDIGEISGGRVVLKGRKQERIRRQGYTISPRDIEWALHKDEAISDAYVMGVQHPERADDELVYFLVTKASEDEIMKFCKEAMPSVWRPTRIIKLEEIPRTHSGKPKLPKLRAML
ncbi:acyl--CoA ligase [Candidatus Saccharibacteria bacterium]|nr:acyl--CoA ligase [Candidatus Saccharibacteria bacterium]